MKTISLSHYSILIMVVFHQSDTGIVLDLMAVKWLMFNEALIGLMSFEQDIVCNFKVGSLACVSIQSFVVGGKMSRTASVSIQLEVNVTK